MIYIIKQNKPQNSGISNNLVSGHSYLGDASRTEPVPIGNGCNLGPVAVGVAAFVTAITEEKQFFIVALPTDLAVLQYKEMAKISSLL